jgi:hypothetical protein
MTNKRTNESSRLLSLGSNIKDKILWNFFSSNFVKKERKYLVNDPTYFLFHDHNKFSSLNISTPQNIFPQDIFNKRIENQFPP